jgi:hypothetical protein
VFQALRYTGQCVDIQMRAFVQSIEPQLTPDERAVFEQMYFAQSWLGGIPLVVLHRYFAPLREAIEDLWLDPENAEKAGVLLRVLQFHAEMVTKRREADRLAKLRGDAAPKHCELVPDDLGPTAAHSLEELLFDLNELGKGLARVFKVRCECGADTSPQARFNIKGGSEDSIAVVFECPQCHRKQQRSFSYVDVSTVLLDEDEQPV